VELKILGLSMLKLKTYWQNNRVTCAACAYGTFLNAFGYNLTEAQCCDDVKTTIKGSHDLNVFRALKNRKIECSFVQLNTDIYEYGRWLYLNSINRVLYVSLHGSNKGKRGRPTEEYHAITISNGLVYDSALKDVMNLDAFVSKYNHKLIIECMILADLPIEKRLPKGFEY
jgi:hypothetical protein